MHSAKFFSDKHMKKLKNLNSIVYLFFSHLHFRINMSISSGLRKDDVSTNTEYGTPDTHIRTPSHRSEKTPLMVGNASYRSMDDPNRSYRSRTLSVKSVKGAFNDMAHTISASIRHLQKSVGFLQGFTLIVGILIGSGVFISPSLIMIYTQDAGLSFVIWTACGLIALGKVFILLCFYPV